MNTTELGDRFEGRVFELLQKQIAADEFYVRRECCQLFKKKGYYSRDRGKDIIFDVSVEVTLPGETKYSLLILIECKSYSKPVGVEDLEEFWSKVQQVAGANVKAIVASTSPIQEGGLRFAESRGFGVIRFLRDGSFKWQLKRSASWSATDGVGHPREVRASLTADKPISAYYDCACFVRGALTYSSQNLFEALCMHGASEEQVAMVGRVVNTTRQARPSVPFIEKRDIEARAAGCLQAIGYSDGAVDLARVCDRQRVQSGLSIVYEPPRPLDEHTLGTLSFDPLEIRIYSDSIDSGRARFTLAHELGHLFMEHGACLSMEVTEDTDLQADAYASLDFVDLRRMEWQANFFAACLLLPAGPFVARFLSVAKQRDLYDRGFGMLYVDHQPVNMANFMAVTGQLSSAFSVSREVTVIRLKGLGYLTDARFGSDRNRFVGSATDA